MNEALKHQHEMEHEFISWVKDNEPSPLIKVLVVTFFALGGIFPYGGNPAASAVFPLGIVSIATATTLYLAK